MAASRLDHVLGIVDVPVVPIIVVSGFLVLLVIALRYRFARGDADDGGTRF